MKEQHRHMALAICSGCGIGDAIDLEELMAAAESAVKGIQCFQHPALCSESGIRDLVSLTKKSGQDRVAVAACSPRVKTEEFSLKDICVERINLREQVAWSMENRDEDTQMCAEDLLCMALTRLSTITYNEPYIPDVIHSEILVVGGGVAGLAAALEGALAGYRIHLLEKSSRLGGYAGRIHRLIPSVAGTEPLSQPDVGAMVERIDAHPGIDVHLETVINSISGEPGNFEVRLQNQVERLLHVGSVVVSTGWKPYDTAKLKHLGYGLSTQVKTLEEFEDFVAEEQVPESVLFVLCAGSRDPRHLPYCSSYCCSAALKQALYVREYNPESIVYVVYRDIRTPGFEEEFYKEVQADEGIFLTKGTVESVISSGKSLRVSVKDSLLGESVGLETEMVILATGMVPAPTEELQLQYRLGKGLPEIEYAFPDSHFICFPYETRRTGIYSAGAVRAPMDLASSLEDGTGAMLKAVQCIECVKRGEAVHPRSGDITYPELYMERCTDCKRCTEECPFGSYDETEKGTPLSNPARCRRCGICMGSCPERVIGFSDFSIHIVSAMIKSVHVPDEFEEKPRILVFLCENDAYPALDTAGIKRMKISPYVRIIPVRCLGSINKVWISDALSHGYDGILQIGCMPGENYQCHFIQGSELTEQRGEHLQETLETMMLEPERIRTGFVEISDHHGITKMINDYVEEIVQLGPNPYKSL